MTVGMGSRTVVQQGMTRRQRQALCQGNGCADTVNADRVVRSVVSPATGNQRSGHYEQQP